MGDKVMPVDRINHSMMMRILRNPFIFKMRDMLQYYDSPMSVSMAIGRAGHKALETYYGANEDAPVPANDPDTARQIAREAGRQWLQDHIGAVNFGKTGNPESMHKTYEQAMDFYFAEEPEYHEIVSIEEKFSEKLTTLSGEEFPLPASGMADVLEETAEGDLDIIDTKFVRSFASYDEEDGVKIIQAMFLFYLVRARYKKNPRRCIFRQIKTTKNKDGSPQIQDWVVPYDHDAYHVVFYNLFRDVVEWLKGNQVFLPNITDQMSGGDSWLIYSQGLVSSDMTDVEVMHKVRDVAFKSKKFIINPLDRAENEDLPVHERISMSMGNIGIPMEFVDAKEGPTVTQYRFKLGAGIRMATVKKQAADIQAAIRATGDVRVLAPVPGTNYVGIEVENAHRSVQKLKKEHLVPETLSIPVGVKVDGTPILDDLREMPHLLIAGATGSGKSVLLHTILEALTKQMTPEELEIVLIDPKRVELSKFARRKHVKTKVLYEWDDTVKKLMELSDEMERRYKILEKAGKRDLAEFNASKRKAELRLPYITVVIDEFADLILRSGMEQKKNKGPAYTSRSHRWLRDECSKRGLILDITEKYTKAMLAEVLEADDETNELKREDADVEFLIVRLAQMARAVGIHLVIATQRPSVDVVTGLIKANFPTRIALTCSSPTDSKVILGTPGAEKLSGKGDMLYQNPARRGKIRAQGFTTG